MALTATQLTRVFVYNGTELPDPNTGFSPKQVAEIYANAYPELLNISIEGPEVKGNKSIYTFHKAAGTKG